jgi:DNA gyrase/topoisomerase IV subunit A
MKRPGSILGGKVDDEILGKGKTAIIVKELPYQGKQSFPCRKDRQTGHR